MRDSFSMHRMVVSDRLRWIVRDSPTSLSARRRALRWQWLLKTFPDLSEMSVIDLGGSLTTWLRAPVRAKHVHIVNIDKPPADVPDWAAVEKADACALPAHIANRPYDLVFSNSVLEHVGGHQRRVQFAESVRSLSERHWVQTPYRYFPIEPHWLFPCLQFLPIVLRSAIARSWPLSYTRGRPQKAVLRIVLSTELIDRTQMGYYFPDSELWAERVAGLTKSLIAIKRGPSS
jgi:hypothetical protein